MNRNIECIERLITINHAYEEIGDWLVLNEFANQRTLSVPHLNIEKAELIYETLKQLEKDKKLLLLYFEWSILPKETIKITCVTPTEEKLFTYGL